MSEDKAEYKTGELVSGRQFAKIAGFKAPSYVAKLKKLGVLQKCFIKQPGKKHKLINVELALAEIEASADPAKDYVRQRWEQYRAVQHHAIKEKAGDGSVDTQSTGGATSTAEPEANVNAGARPEQPGAGGGVKSEDQGQASSPDQGTTGTGSNGETGTKDPNVISYQDAKTRKEVALAKQAEMDYLQKIGQLVSVDAVNKQSFAIARLLRDQLLAIPGREAQVLAAQTDPARISEILTKEIEQALHDVTNTLESGIATGTATR